MQAEARWESVDVANEKIWCRTSSGSKGRVDMLVIKSPESKWFDLYENWERARASGPKKSGWMWRSSDSEVARHYGV